MNYSLETLIEEFSKHAAEYERATKEWNELNPTTQRDLTAFILPRALLTIVSEIKKLKDQYDEAHKPKVSTNMPSEKIENS